MTTIHLTADKRDPVRLPLDLTWVEVRYFDRRGRKAVTSSCSRDQVAYHLRHAGYVVIDPPLVRRDPDRDRTDINERRLLNDLAYLGRVM